MTPERWSRITSLFEQALEQPVADRDVFITAGSDDEEMRREVRSMLDTYERHPDFLEQPVDAVASLETAAVDLDRKSVV